MTDVETERIDDKRGLMIRQKEDDVGGQKRNAQIIKA